MSWSDQGQSKPGFLKRRDAHAIVSIAASLERILAMADVSDYQAFMEYLSGPQHCDDSPSTAARVASEDGASDGASRATREDEATNRVASASLETKDLPHCDQSFSTIATVASKDDEDHDDRDACSSLSATNGTRGGETREVEVADLAPSARRKGRVSFGSILVRDYPMTLGDNPSW